MAATSPDGFIVTPGHPLAAEHELLSAFLGEYRPASGFQVTDSEAGARIARADTAHAHRYLRAALERIEPMEAQVRELRAKLDPRELYGNEAWHRVWNPRQALQEAIRVLLRKKLPSDAAEIEALLAWVTEPWDESRALWTWPFAGVIKACEDFAARATLSETARTRLRALGAYLEHVHQDRESRKLRDRVKELLNEAPSLRLNPGEAWSDAALADLRGVSAHERSAWETLILHCRTATEGKPSAKWLKSVTPMVGTLGDAFRDRLHRWLPLVDKPRTVPIERRSEYGPDPNLLLDDANADVLKGLVWAVSLRPDADLARALSALALSAYKKVPGIGPRATKVGNACIWALGEMPGDASLAALAILKVRVKFATAQKGIEHALNAVAQRAGVPREELEEMGVPAYGMDDVGVRREQMGDMVAELAVNPSGKTVLRWLRSDGKPQKTVPTALKDSHQADIKELKQAGKDIEQMLVAQRDRLDGLFLAQKAWPFSVWRERYLDHPLVGTLARRLIWVFRCGEQSTSGIWHDGRLVDTGGREIAAVEPAIVRLWHPIDAGSDEVVRWRAFLEERSVQQPFKQAHREVYILTDAERRTGVYSNRYASHIVKQHQFNALCAVRGWKSKLRLMVDDVVPPATRYLTAWNLRAEFWTEGAGNEHGTDTTEAGAYLYLSTDQVRFYRITASGNWSHASGGPYESDGADVAENHPLPLADIPAVVFSEIMRDIDLFVGVASVGNDPAWSDGGPEGRYRDYWAAYSFGELSETAQTRRDVLERLIPRLKIHDRCRLEGRFLVVRGELRTYKIHLGSANILMEPNDEYLCIVPAQGSVAPKTESVYLPFEGDARLSLVLSKAFLLANDKKIQDRTILSQIARRA